MWIADNWNDFEILDCSAGDRLERWGDYILIRPDPQVIWDVPRTDSRWKHPNARYHRSREGGGQWEFFNLPAVWTIRYEPLDLTFRLKPFSFKHTGLFPEQAVNWEWCADIIRKATAQTAAATPDGTAAPAGRTVNVLNLFAYTGGATLAAARAGASVTHVDAAKGMVQWAKENAAASGLADAPIRWLVDDCVKFVEREIRRGSRYDAIILDPPSYGRGPKGELWKIEDALYPLLTKCVSLLSDEPLFLLLNSYTTGLAPGVLSYLLGEVMRGQGGPGGTRGREGIIKAEELGLPVTATGFLLPCGASGRWER